MTISYFLKVVSLKNSEFIISRNNYCMTSSTFLEFSLCWSDQNLLDWKRVSKCSIQAKQSKLKAEVKADELQKNIKKQMTSLGEQQAKSDKAWMKTKNSQEILKAKMEEAKQKAYRDEIDKPIPKEDEQKFIEAGELEAKTDAQKQLNEVTLNNRRATFALARAKANNDYYDSEEMKALNEQIISKEISTKNYQCQIEQNKP